MIVQAFDFVLPDSQPLRECRVEIGIQEQLHSNREYDPFRREWCFGILEDVVAGLATYDELRHEQISIRITDATGNVLVDTLTPRNKRPWHSPQELLEYHSGQTMLDNYRIPSLIGTLRSSNGCCEPAFAEFMRMAIAEHHHLSDGKQVSSQLILCFWSICRAIRSSKVTDAVSLRRLEMWLETIEDYVERALVGFEPQYCLLQLLVYLRDYDLHDVELYQFVIPYAKDVANADEFDIADDARVVLRKLGTLN